ncbi:Type-1 restriction enzyme R protein [Actinomyces bovis]|uniref:Type I restriction enzyme endonuclease subunit n=1 Tax=Actinomyces bovis TaxID=1658 RepID=A0ABY1VMD0_9ACTO|nr:type I restriction endonuclease subunit R [Actinomyces bovis]SPT53266.1 Type-1 restriction enzyme R protein [Actinomyces bovis]VEG52547.1 Type-1 restriction enzyme R protein [Actinomyces israelii]
MLDVAEAQFEEWVLELLAEQGWQTVHGPEIAPGMPVAERADYREVVLVGRLREAISRLNPTLPPAAIDEAVKTALRPESAVVQSENWRAYQLLTQGVPVEYREAAGRLRNVRARLIDWDNPHANDLLAVNQFTIQGAKKERRPDVVLFVNGLPLGLLELKKPGAEKATIASAYAQIQTYKAQIPELFTWNQGVVLSDGFLARMGTLTAQANHFQAWKTVDGRNLETKYRPEIEVMVAGFLRPEVFLDWSRNFLAFTGDGQKTAKIGAKYHQYWAVSKAVTKTIEAVENDGRAGIVWHTQGSGKSFEMAWCAGVLMRHQAMDNPTLLVLTDRNDLDNQLFEDTFAATKIGAPLPEAPMQAESRAELKQLLTGRQSGGIIFTTIQKFGLSKDEREAGISFPTLSERLNIVVMVDEAHRSNYDFIDGFARHLRDGLPNATFIGFTGTPIEAKDRSTTAVFGEVIDTYDLTQAVEDGATVKVLYEARLAKVRLPDDALKDIDDAFADAVSGSEEDAQERLKTRWSRVEAVVGANERLDELARDIVAHWEKRKEVMPDAKCMIVAMSRRIAVDLYDKIKALRPDWHADDDERGRMKVVMTGSATDPEPWQEHIRNKAQMRALKARASDPDDPLDLVIVRDMWLTGFDSPAMTTMYVDKPMRGVSLMQAITRVNRTFRDKPAGLIVDYIGIAEDLKTALGDYTQRDRDNAQVGADIEATAIPEMRNEHDIVCSILAPFPWRPLVAEKTPRAYINAVMATVEWLLEQDHTADAFDGVEDRAEAEKPKELTVKQRFVAHVQRLRSFFSLVPASDAASAIRDDVAFFDAVRTAIAKTENAGRGATDAGVELDTAIRQIVSENMTGTGVIDIYAEAGIANPDISLIDEAFVRQVTESDRPNIQMEALKRLLSSEIKAIAKRNLVKGKEFSEMLNASLLRYQNRSLDTAAVVAELVQLAQALRAEHERGKATGLTDNELAFYDALRTNESAREAMQDDVMKQIAHELTDIVRRDAKTDWNIKEQVRAKLRTTIKRLLLKHGYPPDKAPEATELILKQAETIGEMNNSESALR